MTKQPSSLPLFALRLKKARERLGISQMELGVKAGIDEFSASARINQYERGKHTPDFSTACSLANVLKMPTAYFYTEDESLAELIVIYGQLKAVEKKMLYVFAESLIPSS
ncbi:helix-turn-helix domain-containing protein [Methylotenera sp. 1P/1]|uniref:helix-turn-helix domain-containing protein n=1 Tax=Methylotenera sp. 1P/1 TaxID=1131551 RepID=UPI0003A615F1|nr:helix-turn-helix transcriptional regulator [Methylotenera sp. 1P/1]